MSLRLNLFYSEQHAAPIRQHASCLAQQSPSEAEFELVAANTLIPNTAVAAIVIINFFIFVFLLRLILIEA